MVAFIKSKRTSFVNKPVGVVAADTGARQLGLAIAETGDSLQKIFWEEAKQGAIKGDIEKANTLAIRDKDGKLVFEKANTIRSNFSKVGAAKANDALNQRYANAVLIKSKARFGELHAEYTRNGKFDKDGFDLAANKYIEGHVNSFRENNMGNFVPAFLSKVQNQAVLHSNKILNDKIAQENAIASENEKIIIDEEIQELEALNYNAASVSNISEEGAYDDFAEEIKTSEKDILARIESLKGKPNGLNAPAIKELKRKIRVNSALGVLQSIIDKNPTDDKAIKILEMAFQGNTVSPNQRAYLINSDNPITESDLRIATQLKDRFKFTYSDRSTISGILSKLAGDAAANNQKLSISIKSKNATAKLTSSGFHTNSKPSREEFELGLENIHGPLDMRSFMMMDKKQYEAVLRDLRRSTILPQKLYEAFSNKNVMSIFENLKTVDEKKRVAFKLLNTWNILSKREDVKGFVSSRYPSGYNDIEKRFAVIKAITDIGGADYLLPAFEIANMSPESKEGSDKLLMSYNEKFELNATKPADVINAILTKTDIDKPFHKEFFGFTKALLHAGEFKDKDGKGVEFTKDNIVEVLNNTFLNLFEDDGDETFQLYGNVLGGRTNVSYKNYYKNEGSRSFFTDYVNNKLETRTTYDFVPPEFKETATVFKQEEFRVGENGNAKYLPSYANEGGASMIWTLVDEDKVPILGFDGMPITINTQDVDRELIKYQKEQERIILAKNYNSRTLTKSDIDTVLKNIDINKNNFFALKNIREQYSGMNPQIDAKLASMGNAGISVSDRLPEEDFDQTIIVPQENMYTKGLNYFLSFFENDEIDLSDKDFPEVGSTGTENPAWQYIYNKTITDKNNTPAVKQALDENFNEEVAIEIVDDVVTTIQYLGGIEGFKSYGYKDGVGKHATISIGAGFNIKYLTESDLAILSDDGRAKVKELQKLLASIKSGGMTLEEIEKVSRSKGVTITAEQSQKIFRNKVVQLHKQFTKEFPNFSTLHPDRKMALIDHAYQMGYGAGEFKKYWREVSAGLNTNDPKRRNYHFMMAGSHLIYNFNTESQEAMSNLFVTGKTLLNVQFENYGPFGNDRIYDRAELLGYITENRPSYMDKAGVFAKKVRGRIEKEVSGLIK